MHAFPTEGGSWSITPIEKLCEIISFLLYSYIAKFHYFLTELGMKFERKMIGKCQKCKRGTGSNFCLRTQISDHKSIYYEST